MTPLRTKSNWTIFMYKIYTIISYKDLVLTLTVNPRKITFLVYFSTDFDVFVYCCSWFTDINEYLVQTYDKLGTEMQFYVCPPHLTKLLANFATLVKISKKIYPTPSKQNSLPNTPIPHQFEKVTPEPNISNKSNPSTDPMSINAF